MRLVPACVTLVATAFATMASSAPQRTFDLPLETAVYKESDLPGYQLVQRHCIGCHSAHYVQMQPSTLNRTYWENTVKRMKKPFGAPFPDEDIAAMVDYLVKTYGPERPMKPAGAPRALGMVPPPARQSAAAVLTIPKGVDPARDVIASTP